MLFNIKNLVQEWAEKADSESHQTSLITQAWKNLELSSKASLSKVDIEKSEVVVEVENHSLMSNMQFEKQQILNKLNKELEKTSDLKIKKLRFRLRSF